MKTQNSKLKTENSKLETHRGPLPRSCHGVVTKRCSVGGTVDSMSQERRVVHHASRMAVVTLFCRISGYLRDKALFSVIGAGQLYDMYRTANRIPNAFRGLFAEGTLHAAFVPTLSQLTGKDGNRKEAASCSVDCWQFFSWRLASWWRQGFFCHRGWCGCMPKGFRPLQGKWKRRS